MRILISLTLIVFCLNSNAQGLTTKGTAIVDEQGKEVILKGMGIGGWMLQEPYMLQLSGTVMAQHEIKKKITELIGKKNTATFYEAWLQNHFTKGDIDSLASWGFNSIRLPLHYNLFTLPIEEEPVKGKDTWLNKGFQLTDSIIKWCAADRIYVILDLHAAPGGQGNDNAIADRDTSTPSLWQAEANQKKTIALWKKLAQRYANEKWIGGYDMINEPNWGFDDVADTHGCSEKNNLPLKKLLQQITAAIRSVDTKHILFVEANCWANNYNGIFPLWDKNMVVSFHKYWNFNTQSSIENFLNYRTQYNVPIWLGETGENSNAWFTDVIRLAESNKIGWCMWPLKKSGINNPLQVVINKGAQDVFDYWNGKAAKPDPATAFKSLMEFAGNTNIKKNIYHKDIVDAMMRQINDAAAVPYKKNIITNKTILFAADYDLGRSGVTYYDKDSAEYWVSTSKRTGWNNGGQYRNDGVDIENCTDKITNGYNLTTMETGEWTQYSINVAEAGNFNIDIRTAAKNTAKVKVLNADQSSDIIDISSANNYWQTVTAKNIQLHKGWNSIRILAVQGELKLNYLQFIYTGQTTSVN